MSNAASEGTKTCTQCGRTKAIADFARARQAPNGVRSFCKECSAAKMRAWKMANPEKVREASRRYAAKSVEQRAEQWKRRYARDRERILEYQRSYRAENPERIATAMRSWAQRNPEKVTEYQRRRRARKGGLAVERVDLEALWTGHCALCGEQMSSDTPYPDPMSKSLDHIVPLSRGGAHVRENLQWAHLVCNQRKGDRPRLAAS